MVKNGTKNLFASSFVYGLFYQVKKKNAIVRVKMRYVLFR